MLLHQGFEDYLGAWKALEEAVDAGKVRSIGISNFDERRAREVLGAARSLAMTVAVNGRAFPATIEDAEAGRELAG